MSRLATCTGWSFARKRRAVQPSIIRLASASSRSTRFHDLRADEDDDRRQVDPREQAGGEREGTVYGEEPERPGEIGECQLGDLPQHGRYQRGLRGHPDRRPAPRQDAVDEEEEDV